MEKTKLKWFTLIEMLIVMVIIGILAVVLTESYLTISRVALKVEQEKNLSEESLVLTQIFQAISDEATIDYDKYSYEDLKKSDWFVDELYLTWEALSWTKIYTVWNCLELDEDFMTNGKEIQDYSGCQLIMEQNWSTTELTSPWKVTISKVKFRILPYDNDENYFSDKYDDEFEHDPWFVIDSLHQPAFWMFIHLYSPIYKPEWTNKVEQPLQLFFNLKL